MTENAYLVGLRLAGKKAVVIGGGTVAQRRGPILIGAGADVHVIARAATPAVEALAEHIAERCLLNPRVQAVQVTVEKPSALRFARSVGVDIYRERGG